VLFSFVDSNAEDVEGRFENVFMVAADVWEEVFNTRVIEDSWWQNPFNYNNHWKDTGLKVCKMVKDTGKVHILSYPNDLALTGSSVENYNRRRLGRYGKAGQANRGRIHKDCADRLVGVDYSNDGDLIKKADPLFLHSYQSMPKAVEYYASVMGKLSE